MCKGLNARTCPKPRLKEEGSEEEGVVREGSSGAWSCLGDAWGHFTGRKMGPGSGRAETRSWAWDRLAQSTCVYVCGGPAASVPLLSRVCGLEGDTCRSLTPWSGLVQELSCVVASGHPTSELMLGGRSSEREDQGAGLQGWEG